MEDIAGGRSAGRREESLTRFREAVWRMDGASRISDLLKPLQDILQDSGVPFHAFGVNFIDNADEGRVWI